MDRKHRAASLQQQSYLCCNARARHGLRQRVCPSHAGIESKLTIIGLFAFHHRVANMKYRTYLHLFIGKI